MGIKLGQDSWIWSYCIAARSWTAGELRGVRGETRTTPPPLPMSHDCCDDVVCGHSWRQRRGVTTWRHDVVTSLWRVGLIVLHATTPSSLHGLPLLTTANVLPSSALRLSCAFHLLLPSSWVVSTPAERWPWCQAPTSRPYDTKNNLPGEGRGVRV